MLSVVGFKKPSLSTLWGERAGVRGGNNVYCQSPLTFILSPQGERKFARSIFDPIS
jgi:hypothetical protein